MLGRDPDQDRWGRSLRGTMIDISDESSKKTTDFRALVRLIAEFKVDPDQDHWQDRKDFMKT